MRVIMPWGITDIRWLAKLGAFEAIDMSRCSINLSGGGASAMVIYSVYSNNNFVKVK